MLDVEEICEWGGAISIGGMVVRLAWAMNEFDHAETEKHTLIRILVVDDHAMLRKGLGIFLTGYPHFQLVGEASNGEEALALCATEQPHVVLMDLMMSGMDGITATRRIRQSFPAIQVIALTGFGEAQLLAEMIKAGAIGYLSKKIAADDLVKAIRAAHEGIATYSPDVANILVRSIKSSHSLLENLTARERDVLALLVKGKRNNEIAIELDLSLATVKTHMSHLFAKLGVTSRTEAVLLLVENDLNADSF